TEGRGCGSAPPCICRRSRGATPRADNGTGGRRGGVTPPRSVDVMITAEGLTKRFGDKTAVQDVTFTVAPGTVTGFLGPNGAGKSTTMRMIVGLDKPTSGRTTVNGQDYRKLRAPLTEVGVLLDAKAVHTGRTARNHLRAMAATHGIPNRRVDEVIDLAGIEAV